MNIQVSIFPISGVCSSKQEFSISLSDGKLSELIAILHERFDADLRRDDIMLLHNGSSIDLKGEAEFSEGDRVWFMSHLTGG